jgi:hypothetical protein
MGAAEYRFKRPVYKPVVEDVQPPQKRIRIEDMDNDAGNKSLD